jgi:predicted MFS family arabinose efflux permease
MNSATPSQTLGFGRLAIIIAGRFVLNTVFRLAYPLLPFVALRYGVSEQDATWIVTANVLFGLASPFGGWLGERFGYRPTMLLGLALTLSGALCAALAPTFGLLVLAFSLCGLGTVVYQPAMQAYVGSQTPYHLRGRAIGLVELSWALAGIFGVPPLMRLVQAQATAAGAFGILAAALALVTLGTFWLPPDQRSAQARAEGINFAAILASPSVRGLIAFVLVVMAGAEAFYIVQPVWATAHFGASLSDLGLIAFVFGVGELVGSSLSTLITDRLGKLRATVLGFGLTSVVYLVLPLAAASWAGYLGGYLLLAICVEFAIVATLTLASTVRVTGRAAVMALTTTAFQIGRAIGSRIGVPVLERTSLGVTGLVAAGLVLAGLLIALRYVHEAERVIVHEPV